ncbi:lipopolysaccharide biosynthesis protein [Chloroflexota bacterium]
MTRNFNIVKRVRKLVEPGEGLHQRTVRSGVWVFALKITDQLFGLMRLIILARVLTPHDFGLIGLALLAMATLHAFTTTGFPAALIQRKERTEEYLNVAWTIHIVRGLALSIILFFAAPYVAIFFDAPMAAPIVRVMGISVLLQGFSNVGVVYFEKELEFSKQFFYQLSGTLANFVVTVSAALILRSVWAFVFGLLAAEIVRLIVSYFIHPYRPRFSLDWGKAKELFTFGKWILGATITQFLFDQGDDIFVGKLLSVTLLGFYQLAYRVSNTLTTELTSVFSQVAFPAYSKLQDNLPSLREAYLKILHLTTFISIPVAAGIFVVAPEFTQIFLSEKWMPMVPALQMLALFGLLRSTSATTGGVFQGIGKPQINTRWQLVRLGVLAVAIYPLTVRWGIMGTALAVLLAQLVAIMGFSYMVIKVTECGWKSFSRLIALPLISAAIMVLLLYGLKATFLTNGIGHLLLLIVAGITTYFGVTYLLDRFFNYGIRSLIKEILTSLSGS